MAKTPFYQGIDGLIGRVSRIVPGSYAEVEVFEHEETIEGAGEVRKAFLVPFDHLRLTI